MMGSLLRQLVLTILLGALTTLILGEQTTCEDTKTQATVAASLLQVKARPASGGSDFIEAEEGVQVFESGVTGLGQVQYEPAFFQKCLGTWQDKCRAAYANDTEGSQLLCESHLDRGHLKARLLVPKERVRAHFEHSADALEGRNRTVYEGLRLPKFTEEGYKKSRVPADLHDRMVKWFQTERHKAVPEETEVTGKWCNNGYDNDDYVLPWGNTETGKQLISELKALIVPQLREWAQVELDDQTIIYGVRMYHRGSICSMHLDEQSDHIISVIYHLNQRGLQEDWPLNVIDHGGHDRSILSKPGDLIFYESSTTPHGRKGTLVGEEFANIFFHFRPKGWKEQRAASRLAALKYDAKENYTNPKEVTPSTFHSGDECLPYGTGNSFSAAFNTPLMRLPWTHLGESAEPSVTPDA